MKYFKANEQIVNKLRRSKKIEKILQALFDDITIMSDTRDNGVLLEFYYQATDRLREFCGECRDRILYERRRKD